MRRIFWGFCRNRFLMSPLHYLSSHSDFGFEFAEIFILEKRLPNSLSRGVDKIAYRFNFFQTFKEINGDSTLLQILREVWSEMWIFTCIQQIYTLYRTCLTHPAYMGILKGQCHEIFDFWFFSWIRFPQAPENTIRVVSNFFENSRRYSQLKVCHRCQRHRWQMQKIFNHKSFNDLDWTPLGSIVKL